VHRPLTLAVIPKLAHSREIAEDAHRVGLGVMLHLPMEPVGDKFMEPNTIRTTTSDADILRTLEAALADIPYVEGVNNHQGSAATCDERVMHTLLSALKKKDLFFVDSRTIAGSVGAKVAKETGVRFGARRVFLDNVVEVDPIKDQLRKAMQLALKNGSVIAIGHDKHATLRAIKEMVSEIEAAGIKLVYARDLVE
jgi:polysaccharide deacetylase 2 family uncharacterized protein YibQ